jgi:hypothetical protein
VVSRGTVDIPVLFPYSEITGRRGSRDRQRQFAVAGRQGPGWLADHMTRLGAVMSQAIVHHHGRDEELIAERCASPAYGGRSVFGIEKVATSKGLG